MIDQRFEKNCGASLVDRGVALDSVHRLADADFGGEMNDAVDTLQRARDDVLVADVADDQLGVVGKSSRPFAVAVHLLDQAVEHADSLPRSKKLTCDRAADKSCAACHQYLSHSTRYPFLDDLQELV